MNPLKTLLDEGQSIWLDYIAGELLHSGELKRLVEEDGVRGVTSNPTIFEKAILGSADYDGTLRRMPTANGQADLSKLYEGVVIEDIQAAARYIIANPLRAGLAERAGDYPYWDCIWL